MCCSNVAFIPGFQASRLYTQGILFENKLWEPNRNADAEKLFLDEDGVPVNSSIYTRDVIDEGFGFNIYKSFISFMNGLVSDDTIQGWKTMPYDWRLKISDIVQNSVKLANDQTYNIVDEVIALAESSDTGKVTLIGHSNGGLVSKDIIRELERRGRANIVDKLILVAVPQLGTPKALAGLLHGDEQDMGYFGRPLNKKTARQLGENMFGAYAFLPSQKYFEIVSDPVIIFDPSVSNVNIELVGYGSSISSFSTLNNFLKAGLGDRSDPSKFDLDTPNVLKQSFLGYGESIHAELYNWDPPSGIEVVQIAGWGLDTIKGIEYRAKESCTKFIGEFCISRGYILDRRPVFTREGDETVVIPSAISSSIGNVNFYINLFKHNKFFDFNTNRKHADILETQPVLRLVGSLIKKEDGVINYVSTNKPPLDDVEDQIRLSVHSPVALDLYDSLGSHTGLIELVDSDLIGIEEQIPNSYYMEFGEGKYVGFENDSRETNVTLKGVGYGTFTVEIEKVQGDSVIKTEIFKDLLVTPLMSGKMIFNQNQTETVLELDVDGDSVTDVHLNSQDDFDPVLYLEMIKKIIVTFDLKKGVEKQLLQKADKAIKLINKGKLDKVEEKIKKYIKQIDHKKDKKINGDDKEALINMLINLLDNLN